MAGLDDFLDTWKNELRQQQSVTDSPNKGSVNKRRHSSTADGEQEEITPLTLKQQCIDDSSPVLFILPGGSSKVPPKMDKITPSSDETLITKGQLLEQLISDLDDLTSIPFFDIQLPKEIAIMIFRYLDLKDLCSCSLVSKSWSTLAQDNSLWMLKCHCMGYNTISSIEIVQSWKTVVKELVLRERRIQQNWKERVCNISDFQPRHTGTLCCTAYSNGQILSCYSCCSAYVGCIDDESDQSAIRIIPAATVSLPNLLPTTCNIKGNLAVIGYNNGLLSVIDISTVRTVHTFNNTSSIQSIDIKDNQNGRYSVAVCSDGLSSPSKINIFSCDDDNSMQQWSRIRLDLPQTISVNRLSMIDTPNKLLYSTNTSLTLQSISESYTSALHFVTPPSINGSLLTYVNSYCHGNEHVACGVFHFDTNLVRLYDIASGGLKQTFYGHKGRINYIGFEKGHDSNRIVSCSNDKRVIVHDQRKDGPVMKLLGHTSNILCVLIDDWKVISGSEDGQIILWDLRKGCDLWDTGARHPVSLCCLDDNYLITSHIPKDKTNNTDSVSSLYTKQRGLIRIYDFSYVHNASNRLPLICSSKYDEPSASFHHLDLRYPYDKLTT